MIEQRDYEGRTGFPELATSINQGEQRTRERAKNESHEWSRWRTHGVENEGEKRERERKRRREGEKEREKHRE